MLNGQKITPKDANDIGDTTDGTRYIRFIRENFPVKDEMVEGELYHRYWIDEEFLKDGKCLIGKSEKQVLCEEA